MEQPLYFKMNPMRKEKEDIHSHTHTHIAVHTGSFCSLGGRASVIVAMPFSPTHHCTLDITH